MDSNLLPLRDFVSEFCHAKFGGNWTTNKGETEGAQCAPPAYIITKYPSLNRVKALHKVWQSPLASLRFPSVHAPTLGGWKAECTLASRMEIYELLTVLALLISGKARTGNPLICNLMLYHLSYLTLGLFLHYR